MPFNSRAKNQMLDSLDETSAAPSVGITHIGIHTLTDPGTSTNANSGEVTGGSPAYARQAVTWSAGSAGQKTNSGSLTFDVPSGSCGFFTLWSASTGNTNTYWGHIPFGGASAIKGFFDTDPTLANNQFLSDGHGMSTGDRVMLYPAFGGTLPTGVSTGTIYFVVGAATNTFQVSTTSGGSAVSLSALGTGTGFYQRVVPEVFAAQGQITVAASALVLDANAM